MSDLYNFSRGPRLRTHFMEIYDRLQKLVATSIIYMANGEASLTVVDFNLRHFSGTFITAVLFVVCRCLHKFSEFCGSATTDVRRPSCNWSKFPAWGQNISKLMWIMWGHSILGARNLLSPYPVAKCREFLEQSLFF